MSAPLAMNTADGTCWTRRVVTSGGIALYAPVSVKTCPDFVMATEAELAEHGIVGSADALPMPVSPEPQPAPVELTPEQRATIAAHLADAKPATTALVAGLAKTVRDVREHEHPTWEDLYCLNLVSYMGERMGPVLRRLLDTEARVAELEAQRERRRLRLIALQNDALSMRGSLSPNGEDRKVPFELGETLTPAVDWLIARVAELERAIGAEECRCPEPAPLCEGCRCRCHADEQRPVDEDPIAYALTEQAEAAPVGPAIPAQLRAEDTADLLTLAPAQHATAELDPTGDTILLEMTATREQWSAWQTALKVDLARTTNRGGFTTSHATWRGIHVVISRWHAAEDGDE